MSLSPADTEALFERLAAAAEQAGAQRDLFLAKLALASLRQLADLDEAERLIALALRDLD